MRSVARSESAFSPAARPSSLTNRQVEVLRDIAGGKPLTRARGAVLGPLYEDLREINRGIHGRHDRTNNVIRLVMLWVYRIGRPWWDWSASDWRAAAGLKGAKGLRQQALVFAHLQYMSGCSLPEIYDEPVDRHRIVGLARAIFGDAFDCLHDSIIAALESTGYRSQGYNMRAVLARAVLVKRGLSFVPADLEGLLRPMASASVNNYRQGVLYLAHGLNLLGQLDGHFPPLNRDGTDRVLLIGSRGVPEEWVRWVDRFMDIFACEPSTRRHRRSDLIRVGRWLYRTYGISSPEAITAEIAATFNADIAKAKRGDFSFVRRPRAGSPRPPFSPRTKALYLSALRHFVESLVEAEILPMSMLKAARLLRVPKAVRCQMVADPRDIDPIIFAKLLAAALSLRPEDVPKAYPFELWVALAAVWLWSALRKDEIRRLCVDCVRDFDAWSAHKGEKPKLCWLEIPRNKTSSVYTKPVPIEVGEAIRAWLAVRPSRQFAVDRKTGHRREMLFMLRGKLLGVDAINRTLIPLLCRLAGVPPSDSRGPITSHRARATVASALHNADHPMNLFELKEYLGHEDVRSTIHYVRQSPQKMAERYAQAMDAVGRVDVLVDRDAVVSGAAARGEAWIYHAVPGGLCSNDAYAACPHRMACEPKCSFHVAADDERVGLLEASREVRRYIAQLDLDASETAASTPDGLRRLRRKLRDVPVPGGSTPRELRGRAK